jgi:hypothetical protein
MGAGNPYPVSFDLYEAKWASEQARAALDKGRRMASKDDHKRQIPGFMTLKSRIRAMLRELWELLRDFGSLFRSGAQKR